MTLEKQFGKACLHDRLQACFADLPHVLFPAFCDAEASIGLFQSAQPSPPNESALEFNARAKATNVALDKQDNSHGSAID